MAKPSAKPETPQPLQAESTRKIPDKLGGGEVRLYDAHKKGLPDLVKTPPEKLLAETQWFLVHFPSRTWVAVNAGRAEGLRQLKKLSEGKDEWHWLPKPKVKNAKAPAKGAAKQAAGKSAPPKQATAFTPVPEDMDFDRAMKHVFPNHRITAEIEKLLVAEEDIFDREGACVGRKPAWMVRMGAVKLMIEHAQGRAGEKPAPPPEKKKVSFDELKTMILSSDSTRMVLKGLIEEAEAMPPPKAPNPAEVKG